MQIEKKREKIKKEKKKLSTEQNPKAHSLYLYLKSHTEEVAIKQAEC